MQASQSDESDTLQNFIHGALNNDNSFNETAVTIHQDGGCQWDQIFEQLSEVLSQFYHQKLKLKGRFDNLQRNQKIFPSKPHLFLSIPNIYFLPFTILCPSNTNLKHLRDLISEEINPYINYIANYSHPNNKGEIDSSELNVVIHTKKQCIKYRIVKKIYEFDHPNPQCLQSNLIIDKLFEFYIRAYTEYSFQEVGGLLLYWAYKKDFLSEEFIPLHAMKVLIIYCYKTLPFGVDNAITYYKNEKYFQEEISKILKLMRVDGQGNTELDEQLYDYTNYTIIEKRGFYLKSKKRYMKIKQIKPIYYPITKQDQNNLIEIINKSKREIKTSEKSICKTLWRIIRTLQATFRLCQKRTIDLNYKLCYYTDMSNTFKLQIKHPVFGWNLCPKMSIDGGAQRRIKGQIDALMEIFNTASDPIEAFKMMFSK